MNVHSNGEFLDVWDPVKQRTVRYSRTVRILNDDDDELSGDEESDDGSDDGSVSDDDIVHSEGGTRKEKVFDVLVTGEVCSLAFLFSRGRFLIARLILGPLCLGPVQGVRSGSSQRWTALPPQGIRELFLNLSSRIFPSDITSRPTTCVGNGSIEDTLSVMTTVLVLAVGETPRPTQVTMGTKVVSS